MIFGIFDRSASEYMRIPIVPSSEYLTAPTANILTQSLKGRERVSVQVGARIKSERSVLSK